MSQTTYIILGIVVSFFNLMLVAGGTIIFFTFRQYVKNARDDVQRLYKGQSEIKQSFSDFKLDFAQKYAERESNERNHSRMWRKINGIDKGIVYIATKNGIDMKELKSVIGSDEGEGG